MAFTYLVVDTFSIAFLFILYGSIRGQSNALSENRGFCRIVIMTIGALFFDMVAWQLDGKSGLLCRYALWVSNIMCYVLSGLMSLNWFIYVGAKLNVNEYALRKYKYLIVFPCLFQIVVSLLTPLTHWMFTLNENNVYVRGDLFVIQMVIPLCYLFAAAVMAEMQARRERLRQQRQECHYLAAFVVFPLIGGVLQLSVYGLSLAWPCAALSVMLVYVNLQSHKISLDALTGLNNRGQFDKHLYNCIERADDNPNFALFMLDIDEFKKINDEYGHIAGDSALIEAADVLRNTFADSNAFLARYGGDEFAVIMYFSSETQVKDKLEMIAREAENHNHRNDAPPYRLMFSAGYVCGDKHRFKNYQDMITAADARMYLQKQQHKAVRA